MSSTISLPNTKDDIKKFLSKYEKKNISEIKVKTHVRYFSALRDKQHRIKYDEENKAKITFKRGGFLKLKKISYDDNGGISGYVILSNKPIQDTSKSIEWSVPVCETTTFYSILPPKKQDQMYQEKFDTQQREIEKLKFQMRKFTKKRSTKTDSTK